MEKTLNSIKEKFSQEILKFEEKSLKRYYILIDKKDLL